MDINSLLDGKRPVITYDQAQMLEGAVSDTAKSKLFAIQEIIVAYQTQGLQIDETHGFDNLLKAIVTNDYVVDTGLYYVNVGELIDRDEFLCCEVIGEGENKRYRWYFDSFENARPFSKKTLEEIVPEPYRHAEFVLLEAHASEKYGRRFAEE